MPETELTWRSVINPVAGSPALACNICCTISWTVFLLRLRPAFAQMYPPKLFAGLPVFVPLEKGLHVAMQLGVGEHSAYGPTAMTYMKRSFDYRL